MIDWSFVHPNGRPALLQYLHAISIAFGMNKGAEIVARFIMRAKDEQQVNTILYVMFIINISYFLIQLGVMLSLLTSIHPFFPSVMSSVYEGFPEFRKYFFEEEKKKG